jgi:chromatin segregation and condensation protein Rec8/ScpA/Scc1 (kleisin family)
MRDIPAIEMKIPEKKIDVGDLMQNMYGKIKRFFARGNQKLTFTKLLPDGTKSGKVYTFIPLLHLENERKIDMKQYRHFGEINIELLMKQTSKEVDKELGIA